MHNDTIEKKITMSELFSRSEECSMWNLVIECRKFFMRDQRIDENIDLYVTELKNLASKHEFEEIHERSMIFGLQ